MQSARTWRTGCVLALPLMVLVLGSSCGGQQRTADACPSGGLGLGAPPCTCTSWTNYVGPAACGGPGCVQLRPDLSTMPARAVVKVGDRLGAGSGHNGTQPEGCNEGNWNNRPTWSPTDPSVLKFDSVQPPTSTFSVAQFMALAPGVATVAVEDVLTPSGQAERVRLTACSQETALGACTSRVPLDIVVVP